MMLAWDTRWEGEEVGSGEWEVGEWGLGAARAGFGGKSRAGVDGRADAGEQNVQCLIFLCALAELGVRIPA